MTLTAPVLHTPAGPLRWGRGTLAFLIIAALAALWLGHQALDANLAHACRERQWPYLAHCQAQGNSLTPAEQLAQQQDHLRAHLQHNPGDAWAVVALSGLAGVPGADHAAILAAASRLAPYRPEVLVQQARKALAQQDWQEAVPPLVLLATRHGKVEALRTLAHMVAMAQQDAALMGALQDARQRNPLWLDMALRMLPGEKLPMASAMPLVSAMALAGELQPSTGLLVTRQLKAENQWVDAHAVWLQLWKRPLDLLFNGDFEQQFVPGGFDWELGEEPHARAGAQVEQVRRGERGQVLQVRFTGRPLRQPLVSQDLMLPEGPYRLEGDFQSVDLRSQAGLTWVLTCAGNGRELTRSTPIRTTGRSWQTFDLTWSVPADCRGLVLTLQTQAAYEGTTGLRGEVLFDRLRLSRVNPP